MPITLRKLTVDFAIENRYSRPSDSLLPAQMLTYYEEKLQWIRGDEESFQSQMTLLASQARQAQNSIGMKNRRICRYI